mgnify:CR=1 FL=1
MCESEIAESLHKLKNLKDPVWVHRKYRTHVFKKNHQKNRDKIAIEGKSNILSFALHQRVEHLLISFTC